MMAAEIVQQEGDVVNNEGVQISNENLDAKITFYATERQKLESLLQSVEFLLSTCGSQVTLIVVIVIHFLAMFLFQTSALSPTSFFNFIFDAYLTLIIQDGFSDEYEEKFFQSLQNYLDAGIGCLSGSFQLIIIVVQRSLSIRVQTLQVLLDYL